MDPSERLSPLTALCPLDGRYAAQAQMLRPTLSEAGFMRCRVEVEIAWLIGLSDAGLPELTPFSSQARDLLRALAEDFSTQDAARIKRVRVSVARKRRVKPRQRARPTAVLGVVARRELRY